MDFVHDIEKDDFLKELWPEPRIQPRRVHNEHVTTSVDQLIQVT